MWQKVRESPQKNALHNHSHWIGYAKFFGTLLSTLAAKDHCYSATGLKIWVLVSGLVSLVVF